MLERDVMRHLSKQARAHGGEVRKLRWIGRAHAPDLVLLLPAHHYLIEGKRPGAKPRDGQAREHVRLMKAGFRVLVLDSKDAVDRFFWSHQ